MQCENDDDDNFQNFPFLRALFQPDAEAAAEDAGGDEVGEEGERLSRTGRRLTRYCGPKESSVLTSQVPMDLVRRRRNKRALRSAQAPRVGDAPGIGFANVVSPARGPVLKRPRQQYHHGSSSMRDPARELVRRDLECHARGGRSPLGEVLVARDSLD